VRAVASLGCLLALLLCAACDRSKADAPSAVGAVETTAATVEVDAGFVSAAAELAAGAVDAGSARPLAPPAIAGQTVDVPAGTFPCGSTPGDEGREPAIEPALAPVTLGAFAIDVLPYPNDPTALPVLVESAEEAERLCAERGARLCTELEWERACKGPGLDPFATGAKWNEACDRTPSRCASGYGARGMGFLHEWTSPVGEDARVWVRGGPSHRCAARSRASAKDMPSRMAFRCCHGERNEVAVPAIPRKPPFRTMPLETADVARIFAEVPELSRIKEGVRLFSEDDANNVLIRSGSKPPVLTLTTSPVMWSPEPGVEVLVLTGRAQRSSFVVALYPLAEDTYRFASAFVVLGETRPIALAYDASRRRELRWSACWGCAGEQGEVKLRDDGRVVIVQY